jgi:hypothetical protein
MGADWVDAMVARVVRVDIQQSTSGPLTNRGRYDCDILESTPPNCPTHQVEVLHIRLEGQHGSAVSDRFSHDDGEIANIGTDINDQTAAPRQAPD